MSTSDGKIVPQESEEPVIAELYEAFSAYVNALFVRRDISSTLKLLSPSVTGFSTAVYDVDANQEDLLSMITRDMSGAPNPIYYDIEHLNIRAPLNNLGLVSCGLRIRTLLRDEKFEYDHLRLSLAMVKLDERWLVEQMHVSFPTLGKQDSTLAKLSELEGENVLLKTLVEEKTEQLKEAQLEIRELANTDPLTGLFNHVAIDVALFIEINRSLRYNNKLSAVLMSIDHFKELTQKYGQSMGDRFLMHCAELISTRVRRTDIIGRWNAEEFLLICTDTGMEGAITIAEDLRNIVASYTFEKSTKLTASFGICTFGDSDTIATFLMRIEEMLHGAKKKGENQVVTALIV